MKPRPPGTTPPAPSLRDVRPSQSEDSDAKFSDLQGGGTLRQAANWTGALVTLPTGALSFVSGAHNFLSTHTSLDENDLMQSLSNVSTRLCYFSNGLSGTLTNVDRKNIFGIVGYAFSLIALPFVPEEWIYPLSGLTSGLDLTPLYAESIKSDKLNHIEKALIEKHNTEDDEDFNLTKFKTLGQGFDRITDAIAHSFRDMHKEYKENGSIKDIVTRADFNLLGSSFGNLTAFLILTLTPFKTFGKAIRDVFGLQADFGIALGGFGGTLPKTPEGKKLSKAGIWQKWGDRLYASAFPPKLIATIMDFTYRISPIENLHSVALGFDRLGSSSLVMGNICHDASKKAGNEYFTAV